jgi:hypothetical protein
MMTDTVSALPLTSVADVFKTDLVSNAGGDKAVRQ